MPRLSCWFIRAALIYLGLGVTIGGLILWHKGMPLHPLIWRWLPLHIELLLFGWIVQVVMGIGFWVFPRFLRSRGNERSAWLAFWLLNAGVWLSGGASLLNLPAWTIALGRLAEIGSAVAFGLHTWPRIKPPGAVGQKFK